jgi:hypothetical protein
MPPEYLVTCTIPNGSAEVHKRERIVRAKNEAAALKYVVADTITITRAGIDDAMRLAGQGAKVEQAGE